MRNCLLNLNCSDFTISIDALEGDTVSSHTVTIPAWKQITINANSIVNSSNEEYDDAVRDTPIYTDYTIKIFNPETSTYVAESNLDSNVDYLIFSNETANNTLYRIDIVLESDSLSSDDETGFIAYKITDHPHQFSNQYTSSSISEHIAYCACGEYISESHYYFNGECTLCGLVHAHEYTEWACYSSSHHIEKCACGETGTLKRAHAVSSSETGRYRRCIACGATVDTFNTNNQIFSTGNMITVNGSYILPNGIIVLVDEDIEAYLNGELVFYNPNDNSETS